jgi:thiamine pyrophosphate-dependent acetolactate synthase large subunit-like protein
MACGNSQYDVASAMKTVSKWFGYLDKPERTPELMRRAFTMLRSGRPGPVILAATATLPRCSHTPSPSLSRRH